MNATMTDIKTDSVIVTGGTQLYGSVTTQGSKNAALPVLAALPLVPEVEISNLPELSDINVMIDILKYLGAEGTFDQGVLKLNLRNIVNRPITEEFSSKLRASSLFLGPMLAQFGESRVSMPGGCVIGSRPLDIHMSGFEQLGATVTLENGTNVVTADEVKGEFTLSFPSVGATQNLICAAIKSSSDVILNNIAVEPEVFELIHFLNAAGANIQLVGMKKIKITGVKDLKPVKFKIQPDRIEAFTLLVAGIATKGRVRVTECEPEHLSAPLQALRSMGVQVSTGKDWIEVEYVQPLKGTQLETGVYPAFPTDTQQQISILMAIATTPSVLKEKVFSSRFKHLDELKRMGAKVTISENNVAIIEPSNLLGCRVNSFDLRGAASMVIAGMIADGMTTVDSLRYLYRGYEDFIEKLNHLGAKISYK